MALQNFQYDIIMREYNRRQSQVQHDLEERRAEAFARVPRLLEIDRSNEVRDSPRKNRFS